MDKTVRTDSLRRNKSSASMYSDQQENTILVSIAPNAEHRDRPKKTQAPSTNAPSHRPKPSELRELNFWSPTSM